MGAGVTDSHLPVMLEEAVEALRVRPDGFYVDATFGRGGHSGAILERLGPDGRLLAMDRDPQACDVGRHRFGEDQRFRIEHAAFSSLQRVVASVDRVGRVDGVLFDLGVSSPQFDEPSRGFSLQADGPLDMRMDPTSGISAADWISDAEESEIARVLKELGEERHARRVARAIVRAREESPIETTGRLAGVVESVLPRPHGPAGRLHPATRTFMAIRIHVNHELSEVEQVLPQALEVLAPAGRLAVISFHSLEDRIVKRFLRAEARPQPDPLSMMEPPAARIRLCGKPVRASESETAANPRARSAVLRVAERVG